MSSPETPGSDTTVPAADAPAAPAPDTPAADAPADHPADAGPAPIDGPEARRFGTLLRIREFRALWFADTISVLGDQVMRVSVSLLVYHQTGGNAAVTSLVYALTFLPTLLGGALLSGLADRFPRRTIMITTDLARAALFGAAAIPHLPLPLVAVMLVVAVVLGSAFRAAQTATLPDVLVGEVYTTGLAFRSISLQSAQLLGYGVGGVVAGAIGPRWGLVLDAATFVVSAVLLATQVQHRPTPPRERRHEASWRDYGHGLGEGFAFIWRSRELRVLVGLALMSGIYVIPEGLAAPYAAHLGGGGPATGLLMAADPAGSALGAWLLVKYVPQQLQRRWMAVLALVPGIVLLLCWFGPGLAASAFIWAGAGAVSVFQIPASVEFVRRVPDNKRGVTLGLVTSAMLTAQGVGVVLGGVVADAATAVVAVGVAGIVGIVAAGVLAVRWGPIGRVATADEVGSVG